MQKHYQKACDSLAAQTLYVVATPIGNLADITLRALAVLAHVDIVCAEDTRVTGQLLSAYGIQAKLLSVREHNEQHMADKIIAALAEGKSVAQVSDAGTPAVCDPGAKLAARVREGAGGRPERRDGRLERGRCGRAEFLFQRLFAAQSRRAPKAFGQMA